jgi:hypothetical protein
MAAHRVDMPIIPVSNFSRWGRNGAGLPRWLFLLNCASCRAIERFRIHRDSLMELSGARQGVAKLGSSSLCTIGCRVARQSRVGSAGCRSPAPDSDAHYQNASPHYRSPNTASIRQHPTQIAASSENISFAPQCAVPINRDLRTPDNPRRAASILRPHNPANRNSATALAELSD